MEQHLTQYRIFYAVARAGNISRAAKELFISQPAISKSISKLEESLGMALFIRNSRGVSLTAEGQVLFQHVEAAFEALERGENELKQIQNLHIGQLKIGVSNTLCKYILLPYLKGFIAQYPHVRILIESQDTARTISMLEQQKLDIGLIAEPKNRRSLSFLPVMRIEATVGVGAPGSFVVNALGDRFIAENKIMGGITNNSVYEKAAEQNLDTMTYDNMPAWQIFEEEIFKSRPLANLTRSTVGYGFVDYGAADNSDALKKGWVLKADSIEELAKKIAETSVNKGRMNPQKLTETLKRFNEMSTAGKDEDFGRNPKSLKPLEGTVFYAIPLFAGGSNTKGGLKTNAEHQVLDWDGKPIKGLYAAGEIACGLNRGGAMLTDALVFGQVTGKAAATKK